MFKNKQIHSFHLVDSSPWPIMAALYVLMLTFGGVLYMHGYAGGGFLWRFGLLMIIFIASMWWRDIVREGTFEGQHTKSVQSGLRLGMILFIVSEIMFFFGFFWAFFYSSLNPTFALGSVWPPVFLSILDPWKIPLLNTIILLSSGASVTWAHHSIVMGSVKNSEIALVVTCVLALVFMGLQAVEYCTAPFSLSDGVYASTFFLTTGFHGFHVFVGTIFLFVCLIRLKLSHFTKEHHFGFEAAAWYWHFVDVVWLFLFVSLYWWGS
jgi:cytochrome c oxidase subunit 3